MRDDGLLVFLLATRGFYDYGKRKVRDSYTMPRKALCEWFIGDV